MTARRLSEAGLGRSGKGRSRFHRSCPKPSWPRSCAAARPSRSTAGSPTCTTRGCRRWLHRIDRPTLLLWGAQDGIVTPAYGEGWRQEIAGAKLDDHPERRTFPALGTTGRIRPAAVGVRLTCAGQAHDPGGASHARLVLLRDGLPPGLGGRAEARLAARRAAERQLTTRRSGTGCSTAISTSSRYATRSGSTSWSTSTTAPSTCLTVSVPMALAIIARETKTARLLSLGTPIANRPDPVRVAEEMAWLDVLVGRPAGDGPRQGRALRDRAGQQQPGRLMRRYWEAHDLILKAMSTTDGPFNWEGEFFHYRNVNIWPRPLQQPTPPVWMTGLSVETGRLAAETRPCRRHAAVGRRRQADVRRLSQARARARLDRRARPLRLCRRASASAPTREEGLRRADLIADYVRTAPVVAEPFTNPPGYNSVGANVAMLKAGAKRGGFVQRPQRQRRSTRRRPRRSSSSWTADTCFAGTPDDVYNQIKALQRSHRRLRPSAVLRPGRLPRPQGHHGQHPPVRQ